MPKTANKKSHSLEKSIETAHASGSVSGQMSDINKDVLSSLWNDLLGAGSKNVSEQVFGAAQKKGELRPGEPVSLNKKEEKSEKAVVRTEGHMEYFRQIKNADLAPKNREDAAIDKKVEEIRMEIKALIKTSKQLETTFKSVQIEQRVVNAGRYHETLFDLIKSLLKSARAKMEEGASWMGVSKGKKQQKEYWNMFKKHGTTFGLSNERTLATQTG
ncbi:MAG: DUF5660 family protein [Candidatus Levyibacteriota bacterium]